MSSQPFDPRPRALSRAVMQNWQLVFEDDFTGSILDSSKWIPCRWDNKQQDYCLSYGQTLEVSLKENVRLDGSSALQLITKHEDYDAGGQLFHYTSGMVSTATRHYFVPPFYAEARIHFPAGAGLWGAWWCSRKYEDGKPYQEMDFVEQLGKDPALAYATFHQPDSGSQAIDPATWNDDYHVYAGLLEPGRARWYYDNHLVRSWNSPDIQAFNMYLLLNMFVGGWGGPVDDSIFPVTTAVDWVRVWQP